jgi:hypothetical protein
MGAVGEEQVDRHHAGDAGARTRAGLSRRIRLRIGKLHQTRLITEVLDYDCFVLITSRIVFCRSQRPRGRLTRPPVDGLR